MRLRSLMLLAGLSLATLPMMADTLYTYTGEAFTTTNGAYSGTDFISGSFIAPTIGDSFTTGSISPSSFSFTDGLQTFIDGSTFVAGITVSTDASGDIASWSLLFSDGSGDLISTENDSNVISDSAGFAGDHASNTGDPGTWTAVNLAPIPEPSTFALLGTGVLGLAGTVRRRFVRG